ncbi:MAG: nucleotidyl transferase AbiEii/AbiGii toxin family protein [Deltaproteobacteria bacterium]|nr:nucleotidyl transferase AbiEii/AbiGii toxin family protein [Deltaproteobacteria bacterium]MBN2672932.1 nucleotidyl transferase AbiEii/AbiGii toxin family protein [Deltaproteobacteria bacterium]
MFNPVYASQVRLLLQVLPIVNQHQCFALKGGTAINLFVQDMPRLSVDIDLAYLPLNDRSTALAEISSALDTIGDTIKATIAQTSVQRNPDTPRLVVNAPNAQIKIEPNTVFRGAIREPSLAVLCDNAQEEFEQFVECSMLSIADLYGSKICAALDRQHPRDLFDVHLMLEKIGLTNDIRTAFVVYLAGHPRPIAEILQPNEQPLEDIFTKQFKGMTSEPVSLETLTQTRRQIIELIQKDLSNNERRFLLSLKQGEPNWQLLPVPHLAQLPAIQWKLRNIERMSKEKHQQSTDKLKQVLEL